jgi:hypothetical protein
MLLRLAFRLIWKLRRSKTDENIYCHYTLVHPAGDLLAHCTDRAVSFPDYLAHFIAIQNCWANPRACIQSYHCNTFISFQIVACELRS